MRQFVGMFILLTGCLYCAAVSAQYYPYQPAPRNNYAPYPNSAGQSQYYTNPRPAYVPPQYRASNYKYVAPQKTVQNSIYDGRFSLGIDYVTSFASYENTNFSVDSPLIGGDPYVAGTRDFDKHINSLQLNAGWRLTKNFGLEGFYTHSLDQKKVKHTESYSYYPEFARGEYTIYYKAYGLDLLGYYPANDFIEFIASIGVGKYDAEAKVKVVAYTNTHTAVRANTQTFKDSIMGYRVGGGLQIWLGRKIALRLMGRWTSLGGDFVKYLTEINVGVRYHF